MTYISLQPKKKNNHTIMIIAIGRARRFSPNSVSKDAAILEGVVGALSQQGYCVKTFSEETPDDVEAQVYLSMGRERRMLERLATAESRGAVTINSAASVALCCNRHRLFDVLHKEGIPVPEAVGDDGYWLKRGDGCAESAGDVRYAADEKEMKAVKEAMESEGIKDIVVQAHVKGDLVKFYGVRGTDFFRMFYPGDDGQMKFGDESRNGLPQHYLFDMDELRGMTDRAAEIAGVDIYGGDCIVRADGSLCLIDLNDWPSFSRCRDDAAKAIAQLTVEKIERQATYKTV